MGRRGRFLGWARLLLEGTWQTFDEKKGRASFLPPERSLRGSVFWENHFFREDGILQLAAQVHNRGAMDDPFFLADPVPLASFLQVDGIIGFRLIGTNLSAEFLNITGAEAQYTAGAMADGFQIRWRLNWVFHF